MARPKICRKVALNPTITVFKPRGVPACELDIVTLEMDELEAVRLADLKGLYHANAAEQMHISRTTFGRVLEGAHKKIANALLHGKALVFNMKTDKSKSREEPRPLKPSLPD
ncbi:MAG: hypothetical protein A3K03_05840 [Bdellovibrionales bacterium RIFOXYD1_FULL_44_7]|nr:MAG: hypothetical protein A3K03_05840 [Bdellovibrionales bacterium RIFOXYD1_FULL_44_7]